MLDKISKISIKKNAGVPKPTYTLGLLEGDSPFNLKPSSKVENPIISRRNFSNEKINFVADPFAIYKNDEWYLFYESMEFAIQGKRRGKICVSKSADLQTWTEGEIVLEEPYHLSYPHVFEHEGSTYMVPESYEKGEIRLYKSVRFPDKWQFEKVLLPFSGVDSTIFLENNIWWMFTCDSPREHNSLRLFYADFLLGEWKEHPNSPIHENENRKSRPAGKVLHYDGKLYRFAQDCGPFYGHSVVAFEIELLTKAAYGERALDASPMLQGGEEDWNRVSMHHIDIHQLKANHWIAFADGRAH